ncbi:MAG: DUF1585 domain-containing protein, partial [Myxococcales bacterium]|nr:DUF1585 domain-containing protein [Myxococcales bacterium]
ASLLAEDPAFTRCLVEQVMIYALGRGLESQDLAHVDALADALARRGYGTRELFVLVATSAPLRGRAPEGR